MLGTSQNTWQLRLPYADILDIGLIYGRQLQPLPPLLSARDNFFAKEQPVSEETPWRIHLGLLAPPRRACSATDQPSASLLQSIQSLKEAGAPEDIRPVLDLVMYFNSLEIVAGNLPS